MSCAKGCDTLQSLPQETTTCEGQRVELLAIKGVWPTPCVQWQVKMKAQNNWANLKRETRPQLSFIAYRDQDGNEYRALIKTRCECLVTNTFTLNVNYIEVVQNPTSICFSAGELATFTSIAEGRPTPTVQWEVSINGGISWTNILGATNSNLSFTMEERQENNIYRAVFTNSCGSVTSTSASFNIINITLQPVSQCFIVGESVTFSANATNYLTVQWQVSTNGGVTWINIPGDNSPNLTFTMEEGQENNRYRVIFANPCGSVTSLEANFILIYYQNFNMNNGGFTVSSTGNPVGNTVNDGGPWTYSLINGRWDVNGSVDVFSSTLTSPPIVIPSTINLSVMFSHTYNFEVTYDGGNLRLSVNGAPSTLVPSSSFVQNGYNYVISSDYGNPISGQPAWSGQALTIVSVATLGTFNAGDTISLEFVGGWDNERLTPEPNWIIDSITISCSNAINNILSQH